MTIKQLHFNSTNNISTMIDVMPDGSLQIYSSCQPDPMLWSAEQLNELINTRNQVINSTSPEAKEMGETATVLKTVNLSPCRKTTAFRRWISGSLK